MNHPQFIPDPTLDRRLQEIKADIRRSQAELEATISRRLAELETRMVRTELFRWGLLVMLANVALTAAATAVLNAFKLL